MGASMQAYSVDARALGRMIGSADRKLLDGLLNELAVELDHLDVAAKAWGELASARNALTAMILEPNYAAGIPELSNDAAIYIYVFKMLCDHYGTSLDSGAYTMSSDWLATVEEELDAAGVCCEPNEYFAGATELPLPRAFPFPIAGCIEFEAMAEMHEEMEQALSADVDSDVLETVGELSEWASECLKERRDLVWFFF
ncbi:hypothetical protein ACFXHA_01130 [Nocardia sp. NPDC059240]|uniref:DUF7691 family protein n=1 Tax=Nocardia sp. NPDC059240 TaxID=3346786 RepID=UPI0036BD6F3F